MKSIIIITFAIAAISIIGFTQVDAKNPHDIESRLTTLEELLTPTIKDQEIVPISANPEEGKIIFVALINPQEPTCTYLNIGTVSRPDLVVNGWCPASHENVYYISDVRATSTSLVLINVQRIQDRLTQELQRPPICSVSASGTFTFPTASFTGFIMECGGAGPEIKDRLAYTIL